MKETDLAWLAGLCDGEGSYGFIKSASQNGYVPVIQMSMTCQQTILRAGEIISQISGANTAAYTYQERLNHHRDAWYLRVRGGMMTVLKVCEALEPYTVTKLSQLQLLIRYIRHRANVCGVNESGQIRRTRIPFGDIEEQMWFEMRRLNARGKTEDNFEYRPASNQ